MRNISVYSPNDIRALEDLPDVEGGDERYASFNYTIVPDLTPLSGTAAGASAVQTMVYGDPLNYELGLFGDYSIRVDESVKALERMVAILGDAFVGGNLVVDKGFVVASRPKQAAG